MGREEGAAAVGRSSSSTIRCSDSNFRSMASLDAFISSLISRCMPQFFGESLGHGGGGEGVAGARGSGRLCGRSGQLTRV